MRKARLYTCEIRRQRQIAPELCAVCHRVDKCRSFRLWYQHHKEEYIEFVLDIIDRFPEKYEMEVEFVAEKKKRKQFVQIVDTASGKIDRVVEIDELEAMSPEEKIALSRDKSLFIVSHRLETIVRVTMKRSVINEPITFDEAEEEPKKEAAKPSTRGRKKS
ncbi:MAG TPA: hypothetical protein GXX77_07765 [Candidatus Cloacimonetes bacterium]|nr:hypothetical protein [Candidatus Cloacimonadota bacterium]